MSRLSEFASRNFKLDSAEDRLDNMLEPMESYDSEIDDPDEDISIELAEDEDEDEDEDDEE